MAVETPLNQTPLEKLGHATHEALTWAGRHWVPVSLSTTVASLGVGGYLFLTHDRGPQKAQTDNAPASDIFKPPEEGQVIAIVTNPAFGYQQQEEKITYKTEDGDILNIPKIKGLTTEVKNVDGKQKVVYIDKQNNEYAGTYNPNVEIEGRQTGGVVLAAPVALKLIEERFTSAPDQPLVPLPLDLTNSSNSVLIEFTTIKVGDFEYPYMVLDLKGKNPLINIIPNGTELRIGKPIVDNTLRNYSYPLPQVLPQELSSRGMKDISVTFKSSRFPERVIIQSEFGDAIDEVEGRVMILYGLTRPYRQLNTNHILSVDGTPVFVAQNTH